MPISVLYFAGLKETLGKGCESVELPAGVSTVGQLRDFLAAEGRSALSSTKNLRVAINQEMAKLDAVIREGDEVAFFPPVTGG